MTVLYALSVLLKNNPLYICRSFSTSVIVCGRKGRKPYDRRFGPTTRDVAPHKPGGTLELAKEFGRGANMPQSPGYEKGGKFFLVREMIPEFVVPDLTNFQLKPYVSYRVPDVKQSEFTAKDLFDAVYAKPIIEDYKKGKLEVNKITDRIKEITSKTDK